MSNEIKVGQIRSNMRFLTNFFVNINKWFLNFYWCYPFIGNLFLSKANYPYSQITSFYTGKKLGTFFDIPLNTSLTEEVRRLYVISTNKCQKNFYLLFYSGYFLKIRSQSLTLQSTKRSHFFEDNLLCQNGQYIRVCSLFQV